MLGLNAKWISPKGCGGRRNLYFRAGSVFELGEVPLGVTLKIAAESFYKVWVNGHFAGAGPARGSRSVNFYDSLEIGALLRPGRNAIGVLVQCMNIPNFISCPVHGALLAELGDVTWTGDGSWLVREANDEWPAEVPLFCMQVGFMEWRDFRKEPEGWLEGDFSDGGWMKPEILERGIPGKRLLPRPVPPLATTTFLPKSLAHVAETAPLADLNDVNVAKAMSAELHFPVSGELVERLVPLTLGGIQDATIAPPKSGRGVTITFDFGRETIGFFDAELSSPAGAVADIAYDEELENGRLRSLRKGGLYKMADRYILKEGVNSVGATLQERGFRFVEMSLRNFDKPITIRLVKAIDRRYPVSRRAEFHCSDPLLNRIWELCVETLSTCATDIFNDCPWRERAFWVNDLLVENVSWLQAFGDARMNAHALRLALSNVREDGWLPGVCPDSGNPRSVLVATNLFIPLILKDYLLHSGDESLVRELLPEALKLLALFDPLVDTDGLVRPPERYWHFLDWSYELCDIKLDKRKTSLLEWLRCIALEEAASLSAHFGGKEQAETLRGKIPAIAFSTMKNLWPDGSDRCSDWLEQDGTPSLASSQLTHALALLSGAMPKHREKDALKALEDPCIRIPELYLHCFIFQAMEANGMAQEAIDRIRLHWGRVAESGATTLWESSIYQPRKEFFGGVGSLCHAFGAAPVGVMQRTLLGVRPIEPGFKVFSFAPASCGLASAAGSVPTPSGDIRIAWTVGSNGLKAELEIPQGLSARLPDGSVLHCGQHKLEIK